MNPFEKLRKAVDKYNINYEFQNNNGEERKGEKIYSPSPRQMQQTAKSYPTFRVSTNTEMQNQNSTIKGMINQDQRRYIQQINQLSSKNERLTKSLKMIEIEKQQLIQQNCILEKNNEILQQKLKQILNSYTSSEERERRYKQEIHRINRTIQLLGSQLNTERNAKKTALNDTQKLREEFKTQKSKDELKITNYQSTIKKLEHQIEQRTEMLQYNIKKSSQQKRQSKNTLEKLQNQYQVKIQDLNLIINKIKDDLSSMKTNFQVLTHKYETLTQKYEETVHKNQIFEAQSKQMEKNIRELSQSLRIQSQKVQQLAEFNERIQAELEQEKNNIKLKVIEIKDETLQLELQMYKRQCKDLLQEKALSQKFNIERSIQPSYQILSNK